jgi:uncharacterized protein YbjT (DUF2867 family)
MTSVFITGASGFMGRRLSAELVARGHRVRGLVRRGSEKRLVAGCKAITGDPLDAATYRESVAGCDTLVHLVGVAHPSPAKKEQFRRSTWHRQSKRSGGGRGGCGTIHVSVAHPAPGDAGDIAARRKPRRSARRGRTQRFRPGMCWAREAWPS